MKSATVLIAASLALAAHGLVQADAGKSLGQVRSEINAGTWSGITIYKSAPAATEAAASAPAAAASAAPVATRSAVMPAAPVKAPAVATQGAAPATAAAAAPAPLQVQVPAQAALTAKTAPAAPPAAPPAATPADRVGALLRLNEPLSHAPMSAATRLDSPTLGIPLPTAASHAASAADPAKR